MAKIVIELPAMFADHHVQEVRKLLLELPGVDDVYASSSFNVAEVNYDPEKLDEDKIKHILKEKGYMREFLMPEDSGDNNGKAVDTREFPRHSAAYETTRETVSFTQEVNYSGKPLWPCPGVGVVSIGDEE